MADGYNSYNQIDRRPYANTTHKVVNSIKESGLSKSHALINKFIDKGKMAINEHEDGNYTMILAPDYKTAYKKAVGDWIVSFDTTYGDDWDFEWKVVHNDFILLIPVIHFSKYIISNSRDESRQLKNTFVAVSMVVGLEYDDETNPYLKYWPTRPCGMRTTIRYDEYKSHYIHSHLAPRRRPDTSFSRFCIGNAELQQLTMEMENANETDVPTFMLFLISIKTLVTWESIEGVPHMHIRQITEKEKSFSYTAVLRQRGFEFLQSYDMDYEFYIDNNVYKVRVNERLTNKIKELIINYGNGDVKKLLVKKNSGGNWTSFSSVNERADGFVEDEYFVFNAKKYHITVEPSVNTNESENINEFSVYPKFIENVVHKIQHKLFKTRLSNYLNATESQGDNA